MDFSRAVTLVADFLQSRNHPFALIGAFALQAYGMVRATVDVDFATEASAQPALVPFLESHGYETLHRSSGYSNHQHPDPDMGRVDFVYVSGKTSSLLFEAAKKRITLGEREIPVAKPEHLAAMKVFAIRNDASRRFRDLADIQFLLSLPAVDEAEVRGYFEKNDLMSLYDDLKRET